MSCGKTYDLYFFRSRRIDKDCREKNLILMVDHTYLYSSAVRAIKQIFVENNEKIRYFDSTRVNLGKFQRDINVVS